MLKEFLMFVSIISLGMSKEHLISFAIGAYVGTFYDLKPFIKIVETKAKETYIQFEKSFPKKNND